MDKSLEQHFYAIGEKVIGYLPSFFGGLVLIAFGWLLGWLVKRIVIQIALLLHLERYLTRFRWGEDFSKADVRYGFYNFLGNIFFFIVFLIFLDNAFTAWNLTFLSNIVEGGILLFPKIVITLLIFGIGYLLAVWASRTVQRALRREKIPRSALIAKFVKAVLMLLFSAMALIELNIARVIVIIGFATIIITLGLIVVVVTIVGGKDLVNIIRESLEDEP